MQQPREDSLIGELIGDYRLLQFLGEGAAGAVYLAAPCKDKPFARAGEPIALKLYKPTILEEPNELERIDREFRIGSTLAHPNLARIFEIGRHTDDRPYLVMEYVDGIPLSEWIEMFHPVAGGLLLHFAECLVDGLDVLHGNGIIHRDLKPSNVMVSSSFDVKIMDYGVVRVGEDTPITPSNEILGTIRNSSPELLRCEDFDERTDLYSLGTVLYALLYGEDVYAEERNTARLLALIQDDMPELHEQTASRDQACRDLHHIVVRLLSKSPDERPHSAADVRVALEPIRAFVRDAPDDAALHGYVATALTGLGSDARGYVSFASSKIAEVAKQHGFYVYQPRRATDPLLHPQVDAETVYVRDRKRVVNSDLLFVLLNKPSFGVGQEIEIAASYGKPTVLIIEEGIKASRMVYGCPANTLTEVFYTTPEDLERKLHKTLRDIRKDVLQWRAVAGKSRSDLRLGPRLKELRIAAGYESPTDLADKLGLSRRLVEFLENGHLENVGIQVLSAVCRALQVDVTAVLEPSGTSATPPVADLSLRRLESVAKRLDWSANVFLRLRTDYQHEVAASGRGEDLTEEAWVQRRNRLEQQPSRD
jgi:serine/threonine protein kinase/transcriptional regulator with XRE-family HTH domain